VKWIERSADAISDARSARTSELSTRSRVVEPLVSCVPVQRSRIVFSSGAPTPAKQWRSRHDDPARQSASLRQAGASKIASSSVQPSPNQSQKAPSAFPARCASTRRAQSIARIVRAASSASGSQTGGVT